MHMENRSSRLMSVKRGADMTQSLLYAAFALVVLISVLAVYQVVDFNAKKRESAQIMTGISSELPLMKPGNPTRGYPGYQTDRLIDRGILGSENLRTVGAERLISLPYGGGVGYLIVPTLDYIFSGDGQVQIVWPDNTIRARHLCAYLSSGDQGVLRDGPLGNQYAILSASCDASSPALLINVSYRGTDTPAI